MSAIGSRRRRLLRERLRVRDGEACLRCGATENLTIDHVVPIALGGTHTIDNVQTFCAPCNNVKGDKLSTSYIADYSDFARG